MPGGRKRRRTPEERIQARRARARVADERRDAWVQLEKIADQVERSKTGKR